MGVWWIFVGAFGVPCTKLNQVFSVGKGSTSLRIGSDISSLKEGDEIQQTIEFGTYLNTGSLEENISFPLPPLF